jgi:hypothetical protein
MALFAAGKSAGKTGGGGGLETDAVTAEIFEAGIDIGTLWMLLHFFSNTLAARDQKLYRVRGTDRANGEIPATGKQNYLPSSLAFCA